MACVCVCLSLAYCLRVCHTCWCYLSCSVKLQAKHVCLNVVVHSQSTPFVAFCGISWQLLANFFLSRCRHCALKINRRGLWIWQALSEHVSVNMICQAFHFPATWLNLMCVLALENCRMILCKVHFNQAHSTDPKFQNSCVSHSGLS